MKYYQLAVEENEEKDVEFKDTDLPAPELDLAYGYDLSKKHVDKISIMLDQDINLKDWASTVLPVVSKKMLDIILSFNCKGIQYFPIEIKALNSNKFDYYVINYLPSLKKALDVENSKILKAFMKGAKDYVVIPSIIESETQNLDIFRLQQADFRVFVSERLADSLKKAQISGIRLDEVRQSPKTKGVRR